MKITLTKPKEVRRQKRGEKLRIFYRADAKIPFEAFVEMNKSELVSSGVEKFIRFAMNETFERVRERLTNYMKGYDDFPSKKNKKNK